MPNDYELLGAKPVAEEEDPYAALGAKPVTAPRKDDPYAALGATSVTTPSDATTNDAAFDPKYYDPKVEPGKYPVNDLIDLASQKVFEPLTPGAHWAGNALDTGRRAVASLIVGDKKKANAHGGGAIDRLKTAWMSRPELFGGNPDLAPTPEETKRFLHVPEATDRPGFDEQGNIAWGNVLRSKVPNEGATLLTAILTDPLSYASFGLNRAGAALKAAKTDAQVLRAGGQEAAAMARMAQVGKPLPPPFLTGVEAAKWLHPSPSEIVGAGEAALKLHPPHLPLLPSIPGELNITIPKVLARYLKPFDALSNPLWQSSKLMKMVTNPDPRAVESILDRLSTGESFVKTRDFFNTEIQELNRLTKDKAGVADLPEDALADLHEHFNRSGETFFGPNSPLSTMPTQNGTWQLPPNAANTMPPAAVKVPGFQTTRATPGALPGQAAALQHPPGLQPGAAPSWHPYPQQVEPAGWHPYPQQAEGLPTPTTRVRGGFNKGAPGSKPWGSDPLGGDTARTFENKRAESYAAKHPTAATPAFVKDGPIVADGLNPAQRTAFVRRVGKLMGLDVEVVDELVDASGKPYPAHARAVSVGFGKIRIKRGNIVEMIHSLGHELIEDIVREMPHDEQVATLETLAQRLHPDDVSAVGQRWGKYLSKRYAGHAQGNVLAATKELLAEAGGKLFTSPEYLDSLASTIKNKTLLQRVIDRVTVMIKSVRDALGGVVRDAGARTELTNMARELVDARRKLVEAHGRAPGAGGAEASFHIADSDRIKGRDAIYSTLDDVLSSTVAPNRSKAGGGGWGLGEAKTFENPKSLLNYFRKHVKPEELRDTGLEEMLSTHEGPVDLDYVREWVRTHRSPVTGKRYSDGMVVELEATQNSAMSQHNPHPSGVDRVAATINAEIEGDTLRIKEIRSKVHERGNKLGYQTEPEFRDAQSEYNEASRAYTSDEPGLERLNRASNRANRPRSKYSPHKESWRQLGFKRALQEAAENPKINRVTWPAESRQVTAITDLDPGDRHAWLEEEQRLQYNAERATLRADVLKRMPELPTYERSLRQATEEASTAQKNLRSHRGVVGWYTDELPNWAKKYLEPLHGSNKPVVTQIDTPHGKMWAVEMTPELRERILREGQPEYTVQPAHQPGFRPSSAREAQLARQVGLPVQQGLPDRMAQYTQAYDAAHGTTVYDQTLKHWDQGPEAQWHGKQEAALEKLAALNPEQRARAIAYLARAQTIPEKLIAFQKANGLPHEVLNAEITARPTQLMDVLETLDRRSPTPRSVLSAKLRELMNTPARKLDGQMMDALRREVNNPANSMTAADIQRVHDALVGDLPQTLKEYNAVPNYRPGLQSSAAKTVKPEGNPTMPRGGADKVDKERGSVHGEAGGDPSIPGVKKAVSVAAEDREFGSRTSGGRAIGGRDEPGVMGWIKKYLVPEEYKKLARSMNETEEGATFFEPNLSKAFERKVEAVEYQAMRKNDLDTMTRRVFRAQPAEAIDYLKRVAREPALNPRNTTPWPLSHLQAEFTRAGGIGKLEDLLNPEALDALSSGKKTTTDIFNKEWNPHNLKRTPMYDQFGANDARAKDYYLHEDVARQLEASKVLGTDPYQFSRYLGQLAPFLVYMNRAWRKNATFRGPQALSYMLRNETGDVWRMQVGRLIDWNTALDKGRLLFSDGKGRPSLGGVMKEYADTGNRAVFKGMKFDMGKTWGLMDGEEVARQAEKYGVFNKGEVQADITGAKVPESSVVVDNSWAAMLKRKGGTTAKVVGAAEGVGEGLNTFNVARENANRLAGFITRVRQGDSFIEAAIKVEETLFDFSKNSPMTNMLRDTGLVPFMGWHSKIYPFLMRWATEHPGEFVATLRALDAVEQKEIDESQLPEYMRHKHNMIVRKFRNAKGDMELGVVTSSGMLPIDDLRELVRDPRGRASDVLGPSLKTFADWAVLKPGDPDDERRTELEKAQTLARDVVGRPWQTGEKWYNIGQMNPRTWETPTVGDQVFNMFSPIHENTFNASAAGKKSVGSTAKQFKDSKVQVAVARANLTAAQDEWQRVHGEANTKGLMTKDPYELQRFSDELKAAQDKVVRMNEAFRRALISVKRTGKAFEGIKRAP